MNIRNFFSSLRWPRAPWKPSPSEALHLEITDGWDKRLQDESDIDVVEKHNIRISAVQNHVDRIGRVGKAIVEMDNGPGDLNPTEGKVLIGRYSMPDLGYGGPESAFIAFDENHKVLSADIRYPGDAVSPSSGFTESKYTFTDNGDGSQEFVSTTGGWEWRNGKRYGYQYIHTSLIDAEGNLTEQRVRED